MKKIIISSPGKLMLFGEHAVVYGRHCLVAAINERLEISLEQIPYKKLIVDLDSVHHEIIIDEINLNNLHDFFKFVESEVFNFYQKFPQKTGIKIKVLKHFSCDYGFGSSAAIVAALTKGLFELFGQNIDSGFRRNDNALFNLGYKSILDVQKAGSGFDLAASLFGGLVFFQTGGKIIEKLDKNVDFMVCFTGVKANTPKIILELKQRFASKQKLLSKYFDEIDEIVIQTKNEILGKNRLEKIGEFMYKNQRILAKLGVSTPKIDMLIKTALENGAYGAKISGAGGGDCIIIAAALEKRKLVERKLIEKGGKILDVKIDERGTFIK